MAWHRIHSGIFSDGILFRRIKRIYETWGLLIHPFHCIGDAGFVTLPKCARGLAKYSITLSADARGLCINGSVTLPICHPLGNETSRPGPLGINLQVIAQKLAKRVTAASTYCLEIAANALRLEGMGLPSPNALQASGHTLQGWPGGLANASAA